MHDASGRWTKDYGKMVAKLKGMIDEHLGFKYKAADLPDLVAVQEWVRAQTRTSRYAGSN